MKYNDSHGKNASECERVFDVDRRLVGAWVENCDKIKQASIKRIKTQVRHIPALGSLPQVDQKVLEWIHKERTEHIAVIGTAIKLQARAEFEKIQKPNQCKS